MKTFLSIARKIGIMQRIGIVLLVLVLGISACTMRNKVKIVETNFTEVIQDQQNLRFDFNVQLVSDSLINIWDTTQYIQFDPPVIGKFKWTDKNKLLFSPEQRFLPSTDYTIALTEEILVHSDKSYTVSTEKIMAHTAYLKIEPVNAYWATNNEDPGQVEVRLVMLFNYPVSPGKLNELIRVSIDDNIVETKLMTLNPSDKVEFRIQEPQTDKSSVVPIQIDIEKGLGCLNSDWVTEKKISQIIDLPPRDRLMVREMIPLYEAGDGLIIIRTTQPIVSERIKNYITIEPSIDFEAELLEDGIKLKGDFIEGKSYQIRISGKIKGVFGSEMGEAFTQMVSFGQVEPYLSFTDKNSLYLSTKGAKNLGINIVNIPNIKITVFKVFENNIIHYLRDGRSWDWMYEDGRYYDFYDYRFDDTYGNIVFSKEIKTLNLPQKGNIRLLELNPDDLGLDDTHKGLYVIRAESAEKTWLRDVLLVSLSDIGLIVKEGVDDIYVFANSIKDATPIQGVKVGFVSTNSQLVYSNTTDNEGVAVLKDIKTTIPDFKIAMVTARKGDDFNFLVFDQNRVETSRYDVGGKLTGLTNYDVFIYGDRDIYRPGDSVFFNTIVRSYGWKVVPDMPVKIKVLLPNGKNFLTLKKNLNDQGATAASLYLTDDIMTGMFSIEVYSGNDILIGSSVIRVEEFMPDRIKVTVNTDKTEYKPGESLIVDINAMNLFGPPATNRNYELQIQFNRKGFYPKQFNDYVFGIQSKQDHYFDDIMREGKTDDQGNAQEIISLNDHRNIGIMQGKAFTTVFDETGRPVNRINLFDIYTQDTFLGIRNFDYWLTTRKPVVFGFIAVDKKGDILDKIPAHVEVIHYRWESVIERIGNSYQYRSEKKENLVFTDNIILSGNQNTISFTPNMSGMYEVRIMPEQGDNYVFQNFYAYGWGDTDYSSFEVSKEGEIIISLDKENYKPDDKAKILFKAPFNGKLLVTLERDNVLDHYYLDLDDKAASLTLKIKEEFLPNIYVTATAIRKTGNDDLPLTVAHGFASISVEKPSNELDVSIKAEDKSRSKTEQTVHITTTPGAQVTIAVVDEGILQVTDFATPDPYKYFYHRRALEVRPFDLYASLYPELSFGESSYAGGFAGELSKRINPLKAKRIKLMAKWSGILVTDSKGECEFKFNIPQFSGALRVMAVVYKDHKFASQDKMMKVADPVVISTALPRFLSPGDEVVMPVTLTNTTTKSGDGDANIKLTGPINVIGEQSKSVVLKENSESRVVFELKADNNIGIAELEVGVNTLKEYFSEKTEISVRPPSGLAKISDAGSVKGNDSKTFQVSTDFIPESVSTKLVLSKSSIVEFTKNINDLVRYPYGCLEQTVSRAFPLIYYSDLAEILDQKNKQIRYNPKFLVQEAIQKVESMQQYNGGLLFWPGGGTVSWWGSIYAAHFLYEAQLAEYDVNEQVLDNLFRFLKTQAKQKESEEYFYRGSSGKQFSVKLAKKEIFYSLFVLALANQPNLSLMNYYKSRLENLTVDSRYMLAGAYLLIGDKESSDHIMPENIGEDRSVRCFGGSFSSYIRDMAISLYTLIEVDPENDQVPVLSQALSKELKGRRWFSTQEMAFSLLALGKLSQQAIQSNIQASVMIDGELAGEFFGDDLIITQDINNKTIEIETENNGILYYFYELEGISATGDIPETDSYLEVRKKFYDRFGNPLTSSSYSQNDLIVIQVSLRSTLLSKVENVAVTDLLPACFEIENPRITPTRELEWIKDKSTPDYLDIRDDRISFFTTAKTQWKHFYYMVRVVSQGKYKMGPVSADAMYDGQYHSVSGARIVTVK